MKQNLLYVFSVKANVIKCGCIKTLFIRYCKIVKTISFKNLSIKEITLTFQDKYVHRVWHKINKYFDYILLIANYDLS